MADFEATLWRHRWKYFFGIIWDDLFIYEVKMKLRFIFKNFQNSRHFKVATHFFTGSNTGSCIYQQDSHEHFRYFELLIDALAEILMDISQFTLWPADVIDNVMSAWYITCTTRLRQLSTCKIFPVWHQSFIVKSSGRTSWQTNKHTGLTEKCKRFLNSKPIMRRSYIHTFIYERSFLACQTFQISNFTSEYIQLTSQNAHTRSYKATYHDEDTIYC